jgi:hypothetical protein
MNGVPDQRSLFDFPSAKKHIESFSISHYQIICRKANKSKF